MTLYLGLMSGTSMDGIDAALLEIDDQGMRLLSAACRDWPPSLQRRLRALAEDYQQHRPGRARAARYRRGREFALAAEQLLRANALPASAVRAIGSHGQTVLHQPGAKRRSRCRSATPMSSPSASASMSSADFRRRDLAAGGEGAPLMPAFHAAAFGVPGEARAVVNIGGIANVTLLTADGGVTGFDTGPGNCLLDAWARRHLRPAPTMPTVPGRRAAPSQQALLERLLRAKPYFRAPAAQEHRPRDLQRRLARPRARWRWRCRRPDVQATLAELTARSIADGLRVASRRWPAGPGTDPSAS